jgi:hypothetical protein
LEEAKLTIRAYVKDVNRLRKFMQVKNVGNIADAIRIVTEYADSHGALS